MAKNCKCVRRNYSLCTNIDSSLIQMDTVPVCCVLCGVWWETVHSMKMAR